jgi:hypothetical protein
MQWISEETTVTLPKRDPKTKQVEYVKANLIQLVSFIRQNVGKPAMKDSRLNTPDTQLRTRPVLILDLD